MRDAKIAALNAKQLAEFRRAVTALGFVKTGPGRYVPGQGKPTVYATTGADNVRVKVLGMKGSYVLVEAPARLFTVRCFWLKEVSTNAR